MSTGTGDLRTETKTSDSQAIDHKRIVALKEGKLDPQLLKEVLESTSATSVIELAEKANLEPVKVFELLGSELERSAMTLTRGNWLSRHRADLLLAGALFVMAMLPMLGAKWGTSGTKPPPKAAQASGPSGSQNASSASSPNSAKTEKGR